MVCTVLIFGDVAFWWENGCWRMDENSMVVSTYIFSPIDHIPKISTETEHLQKPAQLHHIMKNLARTVTPMSSCYKFPRRWCGTVLSADICCTCYCTFYKYCMFFKLHNYIQCIQSSNLPPFHLFWPHSPDLTWPLLSGTCNLGTKTHTHTRT